MKIVMKTVMSLTTLLMSHMAVAGTTNLPDTLPPTIPEPSVLALFAIGAAALFFARRRK